jgi:LAS superfamily LD-carboxypeptidase LdcB
MYPIRKVRRPAVLNGRTNGKLPAAILVEVPGQARGPRVALVEPAARAWVALTASAKAAGFILKATSMADSYRPYAVQERLFRQRYTTTVLPGRSSRMWNGRRWYLKRGVAKAAVPGTSNHGLGLAVDTGQERDSDAGTESLSKAALRWLFRNEEAFGFSHELQDESWHIRYFAGDKIPAAVLAFEGGGGFRLGMHADPTPGTGVPEEDDVTPQQFLDILRDPAVSRAMRALSWQYQDPGDASAHDIVFGEIRTTLREVRQATTDIKARVEIGPLLATMTPEAVAGLILASLPAERARVVAATLTAGLGG